MATRTRPSYPLLPGARLLAEHLERNGLPIAEFARRATECGRGQKIDRVTISNLLGGHAFRVAVPLARAIRDATDGAVPIESWEYPQAEGDEQRAA